MDAVESKLSTLSLSSAHLTLEGIAARIKNGTAKRVLFMVGAGISVAAGIPDFRTPGTGLYDNLKKYNLPAPEAVFTREYYLENPDAFCQLSEEMWPGKWKPTTAHFFIRLMHQKGHLLRCYSQNIDTLEREAGLPADMLVEAHGSFLAGEHCAACGKDYDPGFFRQKLTEKKRPVCDTCKVGFVKPRITFFGEQLPTRFFSLVTKDFQEGDLLIVMGTSLKVNPFARLISAVRDDVPRILFNNMPAGVGPAGFQFGMPDNKRDVLWLGDVQDGVRKFAEAVGWAADLKALENAYKPSTSASVTPTPSL
jgi:NAD-dependent deacetylase sirtuin 2